MIPSYLVLPNVDLGQGRKLMIIIRVIAMIWTIFQKGAVSSSRSCRQDCLKSTKHGTDSSSSADLTEKRSVATLTLLLLKLYPSS